MTLISYTLGIPNGPDNPSADQPLMKINNDHISQLIAIDHAGFNVNNSGNHNKSTYLAQSVSPISAAGQLVLYSKTGSSGQELHLVRDGILGTDTLLTTAQITAPSRTQNGFTWLPGGLLLQWGFKTIAPGSNTITFTTEGCVAFAVVAGFSPIVTVSPRRTVNPNNVDQIYVNATSATTFTINNTSGGGITDMYWHAIGPI